jgi:hypothetical protein
MSRPCTRATLELGIAYLDAGQLEHAQLLFNAVTDPPQGIRTLLKAGKRADALEALREALHRPEMSGPDASGAEDVNNA